MPHLPNIPQTTDSTKKYSFDVPEGAPTSPQTQNSLQQNPDTVSNKKAKRERKKKEKKNEAESKKNKKEKAELKEQKAGKETYVVTVSEPMGQLVSPRHPIDSIKKDSVVTHSKIIGVSAFRNNELKTTAAQENKIHLQNREYWIPGIVLFSLLIIVWARTSHYKRFSRIGKSFFNIREFYQVVREEYAITNSLSIAMGILFILTLSVFIFQLNEYYGIFIQTPTAFLFFLKIVFAVLLFSILKMLFVRLLGLLFYGKSEQVTDFVYNIFLMNNISGMALIPIVAFMAWFNYLPKPALIAISATVLITIYLYRTLRTFNLSASGGQVSKLYFFTYLCSLEFLPFVVIFKVILNRFP